MKFIQLGWTADGIFFIAVHFRGKGYIVHPGQLTCVVV